MKPVSPVIPGAVTGQEILFAKNQPPYSPLLAIQSSDANGMVTTRWHLTWRERFQVFCRGDVWLRVLTFHKPLQPVKLMTNCPDLN